MFEREKPNNATPSDEELIREELSTYRLDQDAKNLYGSAAVAIHGDGWDRVQPLEHYEDYIRRANDGFPETTELILSLSDPDAVAELNRLVDEFNSRLEHFKAEKDKVAAQELLNERMYEVISRRRGQD